MSFEMNRRAFVKGTAACGAAIASIPAALALADEEKEEAAEDEEAETADGEGVVLQIFAANSLEKAMPEVQALYTELHPEVTFADTQFKASGDLVEQMTAGAVVDILITASKGTMDDAEEGELVDPATRITMFNNDLVVVAAEDSDVVVEDIADVAGKDIESIAIGDAITVPAGKYANQALYSVGLYTGENGDDGEYAPEIADKVNLGDKVGTCASWVSTGDCTVGFVYSSDVYRYEGIKAIYTTPEDSHGAIVYPGAVGAEAPNPVEAADFLDFCMNDPDALQIWSQYGFEVAEEEEPAEDEAEAGEAEAENAEEEAAAEGEPAEDGAAEEEPAEEDEEA